MFQLLQFIPLGYDVIKMFEDDAPDGPFVGRTHVVRVGLDCLEPLNIEPVFALCISLATMNVNRLAPFIGVEKEPLAEYHQYGWHFPSVLRSISRHLTTE